MPAFTSACLRGASWALYTAGASTAITARRVAVVGARTYGAIGTGGALTIENSTLTIDDGIGLYVSANTSNSTLNADHVTVVNSAGTGSALKGKKFGTGAGNGTLVPPTRSSVASARATRPKPCSAPASA